MFSFALLVRSVAFVCNALFRNKMFMLDEIAFLGSFLTFQAILNLK